MHGWAGTILVVDLAAETIEKRPLDPAFARDFLGGRGFNSKLIYDEFDPAVKDPFSPQNVVCISTGALGGTLAPASGRITISVARSPVTGVFGDGNAGGHFGPELKHAGYDTVLIKGAAKRPLYLSIMDDEVELKDASRLWGKTVREADDMLRTALGDPQAQVFAIGPAGENRVAVAIPLCNLTRAPGGAGTGAVLGSKNLKAVVVRGTRGVTLAHPQEFYRASREAHQHLASHPLYGPWAAYGTPVLLGVYNAGGALPVRNWQSGVFPGWEKLDGVTFVNKYSKKPKGCFSCPMHCSHYYSVDDGPYAGTRAEGVEYEATDGFGARSGNDDLASTLYINKLLNELGLDVVQMANVFATAMHLWQDGVIDARDTGGLDLSWGNHRSMVELAGLVCQRRGFGEVFADGVLQGVQKIADRKGIPRPQLERYVIQSKGMTLSSYDPRPLKGGALEVGTSTRGADHLRGLPTIEAFAHWYRGKRDEIIKDLDVPGEVVDQWIELGLLDRDRYEGKGHMVKYYQDQCAAADALEICKFITSWRFGVGPIRMANLLSLATGVNYTWQELMACGDRIYTTEYVLQRRYGLRRESDFIPERFFEEPLENGAVIDRTKYEKMLDEYYEIRGYDAQGIPTAEKLESLGVGYMAGDLAARGVLSP